MKITLAPMSMLDKIFKGKKRGSDRSKATSKPKSEKPASGNKAKGKNAPAPAASTPVDPRSPEERCGITAGMDKAAIKAQLAKMFRRYNRLASSLDGDARVEADAMLDLIVGLREKYLS